MPKPTRTLSENEELLIAHGFKYVPERYGYYHKDQNIVVPLDDARYMKEAAFRAKLAALLK